MKDKPVPPPVVPASDPAARTVEPTEKRGGMFTHDRDPRDTSLDAPIVPPAPTTESELRAREDAANASLETTRLDYSDPPESARAPDVRVADVKPVKAPNAFAVSHIPGTEIVVGGPTQQ